MSYFMSVANFPKKEKWCSPHLDIDVSLTRIIRVIRRHRVRSTINTRVDGESILRHIRSVSGEICIDV